MPDQVIVSYSELDALRQCPLKHQLAYLQRWGREPGESSPLSRGALWHRVMEAHYRAVRAHQQGTLAALGRWTLTAEEQKIALLDASQQAYKLLHDPDTGLRTDEQELVGWMYVGYVERYGADPHWRIEAVEHELLIPLRIPASGRRSRYLLKARLDLIVYDRFTRQRWIVDHKSCRDLPSQVELDLDDQFGLYTLGAREVGFPVMGAVHSTARTFRRKDNWPQPLDARFARTPMFRTDTELTSIAHDAYWAARATRSGQRYSSPNPNTCKWRCDFKDAHLLMRKGADPRKTLQAMGFEQDFTRH